MRFYISILFALSLLFSHTNDAVAGGDTFPSLYAVHQQQGPVCPHLPWVNLQKIRAMRERGEGRIVFQPQDYSSKINSYSWFLPRIRVLDRMYDDLRHANQDYALYEKTLREEGIKDTGRFSAKGHFVDNIDWTPINKARRAAFTPYNIKVVENPYCTMIRWLPILQDSETDQLYFYDHNTRQTTLIPEVEKYDGVNNIYLFHMGKKETSQKVFHIDNPMLETMGIGIQEMKRATVLKPYLGFNTGYVMLASADEAMNKEYFYDCGTYQHMLFACGLKADNTEFTAEDDTLEAKAYREFHKAVTANPLNPWATLNKDDLFEYHLAQIFKFNPELKAKAIASVDFYNNYWEIYKDSFDLYDSPKAPKTKLSAKQRFMPGEDQSLAFIYSNQLRFLWASSISIDALIAVEELEDELGDSLVKLMKAGSFLPGVPNEKKVIAAAEDKKFGPRNNKFSFLDTWAEIKEVLMRNLQHRDLVSFSNHGSVISFDEDLVVQQDHESRPVAQKLGFEMWDSGYDKGLKPFYRKAGTDEDKIRF